MSAGGGGAAGAAGAAVIQAMKASGVIVRVEPGTFLGLLDRQECATCGPRDESLFSHQLPIPDELQRVGLLHEVGRSNEPAKER